MLEMHWISTLIGGGGGGGRGGTPGAGLGWAELSWAGLAGLFVLLLVDLNDGPTPICPTCSTTCPIRVGVNSLDLVQLRRRQRRLRQHRRLLAGAQVDAEFDIAPAATGAVVNAQT